MAYNKETQINASVVLDRVVYDKLKSIAKQNKRSASGQIAFLIEEYIQQIENNKKD